MREQEYDQEHSKRQEINEKLEQEGYKTIKEKMDALHLKALEENARKEGDLDINNIVLDESSKEEIILEETPTIDNSQENEISS